MNEKSSKAVSVTPFAVEANTPRNGDIIVQCLGNMRMRGAVSASVDVFDNQWEEEDLDEHGARPASTKLIDGIGELPGQVLYVNPGTGEWKLVDPLFGDERTMDKLAKAMKRHLGMAKVDDKLRGIKPKTGKVDQDAMKTLCRELLCFIISEEAVIVKGTKPSQEDIEELPGRFLLNPSNLSGWHQPRYEDQYEGWVDKMSQIAGGE